MAGRFQYRIVRRRLGHQLLELFGQHVFWDGADGLVDHFAVLENTMVGMDRTPNFMLISWLESTSTLPTTAFPS